MNMSLSAASESQPVDFTPVRSRTAVVDCLESALQEGGAQRKSKLPSLLASASCCARSNAIKGVEKFAMLVKGNGISTDGDDKLVQKYVFTTRGICRKLSLVHAESVWHIKLDSKEVATKAHSNSPLKPFHTSVDFFVPMTADESASLPETRMIMEWIPISAKWQYTLVVNDVTVPALWSKGNGFVEDYEIIEVAAEI
jgi:hypothetical protein